MSPRSGSYDYNLFITATLPKIDITETDYIINDLLKLEIIKSDSFDRKNLSFIPHRSKFFYITYPCQFEDLKLLLEIIVNKLKKEDPTINLINYCLVNEFSFIFHYAHCHVFIELEERMNYIIKDPRFFDTIDTATKRSVHPNIIGRVLLRDDTFMRACLYQLKSGAFVFTNASEENLALWKKNLNPFIHLKIYSITDFQVRRAWDKYMSYGPRREIEFPGPEVAALKKRYDALLTIPKDLPDKIPSSIKAIIKWKNNHESQILNVFTSSDLSIKENSSFISNHYEGVLDLTKESSLSTLGDRMKDFNKENAFAMVTTILLNSL